MSARAGDARPKRGLIYRTRGGLLVTMQGGAKFPYRGAERRWKGNAFRVDTGGRHGWLWMYQLEVVR